MSGSEKWTALIQKLIESNQIMNCECKKTMSKMENNGIYLQNKQTEFFQEIKLNFALMENKVLKEIQAFKTQQNATDQKVEKMQIMLKNLIKYSNETENHDNIIEPRNETIDRTSNPVLKNIDQNLDSFVTSYKLDTSNDKSFSSNSIDSEFTKSTVMSKSQRKSMNKKRRREEAFQDQNSANDSSKKINMVQDSLNVVVSSTPLKQTADLITPTAGKMKDYKVFKLEMKKPVVEEPPFASNQAKVVINDDFSNIEVLSIVSDEKKKTQYSLAQQKIEIIVTPKEKNPAHQAEKTGTPRIKKSVPVHSSKIESLTKNEQKNITDLEKETFSNCKSKIMVESDKKPVANIPSVTFFDVKKKQESNKKPDKLPRNNIAHNDDHAWWHANAHGFNNSQPNEFWPENWPEKPRARYNRGKGRYKK